jgi:hypothetical protein
MWLDSSAGQDQQDVAVLGVSGSDGRVLYAQRIGGGAEDRAWSLAVEGRELVVAGLFDIDRRDGAPATRVAYARTDLPVVDPGVPPPVAPVVQWSPDGLTYPAPVGAGQLNARFVDSNGTPVSGSTTYSVQVGQVLPAGTHALVATFHSSQAGFTDVTVERSLLVDRAVPQLSWPGASSLVYGQPLPPAAVASGYAGPVSGHLSYPSGAAPGSVLDAGSHALRLAFESTDPNYASTSSTFSITVTKAASHIDARSLTVKRQVTATLRDTSNDVALAYKPVVFYFSNKTCTAFTDASGTATCSLAPGEALTVLRLGFTAVFDGDTNHERAGVQVSA